MGKEWSKEQRAKFMATKARQIEAKKEIEANQLVKKVDDLHDSILKLDKIKMVRLTTERLYSDGKVVVEVITYPLSTN